MTVTTPLTWTTTELGSVPNCSMCAALVDDPSFAVGLLDAQRELERGGHRTKLGELVLMAIEFRHRDEHETRGES